MQDLDLLSTSYYIVLISFIFVWLNADVDSAVSYIFSKIVIYLTLSTFFNIIYCNGEGV
jgi:hypothetical protein